MKRVKNLIKSTETRSIALISAVIMLVVLCLSGCVKSGSNGPDAYNTDNGNTMIVTPLPHGGETTDNAHTSEAGSESPVIADETPGIVQTATEAAETPTEVPVKTAEPEITLNLDLNAIHSRSVLLKDIDTGRIL